jgi:hypothetical protein
MPLSDFMQLIASCFGLIGSIFFAKGVVQQNTKAIAELVEGYWGSNPFMLKSMAKQTIDYHFGVGFISLCFLAQLCSYKLSPNTNIFTLFNRDILFYLTLSIAFLLFILSCFLEKLILPRFCKKIEIERSTQENEALERMENRQSENELV